MGPFYGDVGSVDHLIERIASPVLFYGNLSVYDIP